MKILLQALVGAILCVGINEMGIVLRGAFAAVEAAVEGGEDDGDRVAVDVEEEAGEDGNEASEEEISSSEVSAESYEEELERVLESAQKVVESAQEEWEESYEEELEGVLESAEKVVEKAVAEEQKRLERKEKAVAEEVDVGEVVEKVQEGVRDALEEVDLGVEADATAKLQVRSRKDEYVSEQVFMALSEADFAVNRNPYFAILSFDIGVASSMSLEPHDGVYMKLHQAYAGYLLHPSWRLWGGFLADERFFSQLMTFSRPLPGLAAGYEWQFWSVYGAINALPYEKKNAPVMSSQVPMSVSVAAERVFGSGYSFMRLLSLRALYAWDIPSELSQTYIQRGNTGIVGRHATALQEKMLTFGVETVFGYTFSDGNELDVELELLGNVLAPQGRAYGYGGKLGYHRLLTEQQQVGFGVHLYAIGADAYLAEFGKEQLGYVGVDGVGTFVKWSRQATEIEAGYTFYQPQTQGLHKWKTHSFQLTLAHKLF